MRDASDAEHHAEGLVQVGTTAPAAAINAWKEDVAWFSGTQTLRQSLTVRSQAHGQVRSHWHEAGLAKLAPVDADDPSPKIHMLVPERESFVAPQTGEQQQPKEHPVHKATVGESRCAGQMLTGIQESTRFLTREHPSRPWSALDGEEAPWWDEGPRLFEAEEASELAYHGQPVGAAAWSRAADERTHQTLVDHPVTVPWRERLEHSQMAFLAQVSKAQSSLVRQVPFDSLTQGTRCPAHRRTSSSAKLTERSCTMSTWV
jgi:hypothetical protein